METASVPPRVIVPEPVMGPPLAVRPVVPPLTLTLVTVPAYAVDHEAVVPLLVRTAPLTPMPNRPAALVPVPRIRSPVAVIGERALNAAEAFVWPVPPLATAKVPPSVNVPLLTIGLLDDAETVSPVEPLDRPTEVTVPPPPPPPPVDEIVMLPVDPETTMFVPAVIDVTPVFVSVMPPVDPDVEIPAPAETEVTPALEMDMEPDVLVTFTPVPAVNVPSVYPVPLPIRSWPFVGIVGSPVPPTETAHGRFPP